MKLHLDAHYQYVRYLALSYQLGSMRAAADELGLAPSSISRAIGKLESLLDIDLIKAGAHCVQLTDAGKMLVEYHQTETQRHERILDQLNELRGRLLKTVVIALGDGLSNYHTIQKIKPIYQNCKSLRMEIIIANSMDVQRMVLDDRADIGVVYAPHDSPALRLHHAFTHPLRFITNSTCPLADKTSVTLGDIVRTPLVLPDTRFRVYDLLRLACQERNIAINPIVTTNSLQVILDFVRSNMVSTLLPEFFPVADLVRSGEIVSIPINIAQMKNTKVKIITHRTRKLSSASLDIIGQLAKVLRSSRYYSN